MSKFNCFNDKVDSGCNEKNGEREELSGCFASPNIPQLGSNSGRATKNADGMMIQRNKEKLRMIESKDEEKKGGKIKKFNYLERSA